MKDLPKNVVVASMAVSGLVALLAIADLALGVPFAGMEHTMIMDIMFIICAAIVGYLGWDALKDMN